MLPILLDFGFIKMYTFGVFLTLGFFWGLFLLWKLIALTPYKEEDIFDAVFVGLLVGFAVARIMYIAFNFSRFGFNILKMILINGYPGLSLYGGLLGGFVGFGLYLRRKKIPFLYMVDYAIPGLFVAIALSKLGAFLSGGEVGTPTRFFLRVITVGYKGFRHITGVYEALLFLIAAWLSYRILLAVRREKLPRGFGWYFFLSTTAAVYLLLDKIKANHLYFIGFSVNFALSLVLVIFFSLFFLIFFKSLLVKKAKLLYIRVNSYAAAVVKNIRKYIQEKSHPRRAGSHKPH